MVKPPRFGLWRLRASLEAIGLSHCMDPDLFAAMEQGIVVLNEFCSALIAERMGMQFAN